MTHSLCMFEQFGCRGHRRASTRPCRKRIKVASTHVVLQSRVRLYGGGSEDAVEQSQPMPPPSKQSLEVSSPQEQSLAALPAASPPSKQSLAGSSSHGQSKPQRRTRLSPPEKEQRVQLTWQSIDKAIWTAAFADDNTLQQHCPDAGLWHRQLESTTIALWDHVPVWLKCSGNMVTLILFQTVERWFS